MDRAEENRIIDRIKNGYRADFEYLVVKYQRPVFRIVQNLVDLPCQLEDLVQDIFLAAFANIDSFDPRRGPFRTWLYAIARNRALNARHKCRETALPDNALLPDHRTPMDTLMVKESFEHLDRALNHMPFQDRSIFVLAELEGLPYADIARIEELPLGTVKSRMARIRAKLRRAMSREEDGPCPEIHRLDN